MCDLKDTDGCTKISAYGHCLLFRELWVCQTATILVGGSVRVDKRYLGRPHSSIGRALSINCCELDRHCDHFSIITPYLLHLKTSKYSIFHQSLGFWINVYKPISIGPIQASPLFSQHNLQPIWSLHRRSSPLSSGWYREAFVDINTEYLVVRVYFVGLKSFRSEVVP